MSDKLFTAYVRVEEQGLAKDVEQAILYLKQKRRVRTISNADFAYEAVVNYAAQLLKEKKELE